MPLGAQREAHARAVASAAVAGAEAIDTPTMSTPSRSVPPGMTLSTSARRGQAASSRMWAQPYKMH